MIQQVFSFRKSKGSSPESNTSSSSPRHSGEGYDLPRLELPKSFYNEPERLASVEACGCLNTEQDPRFSSITTLMATVFNTPIALVSLLGEQRCFFKTADTGPLGPSMDRNVSFCDSILRPDTPEVLIVEDASQDARFSNNPGVNTKPNVRFYAGAPLVGSDGYRYGTLCVVDFKPRTFPADVYNTLINFAELVVRELERDKLDKFKNKSEKATRMALRNAESFTQAVAMVDINESGWGMLYANDLWAKLAGQDKPAECIGTSLWSQYMLVNPRHTAYLDTALRDNAAVQVQVVRRKSKLPNSGSSSSLNNNNTASRATSLSQKSSGRLSKASSGSMSSREGSQRGGNINSTSVAAKKRDDEAVGPTMTLTLRPAAVDTLERDVHIGIPSYVKSSDGKKSGSSNSLSSKSGATSSANNAISVGSFWFAVLQAPPVPETTNPADVDYDALVEALNKAWEIRDKGPKKRQTSVQYHDELTFMPPESLRGLKLGILIGTGSFSRVYRGDFSGKPVAVKVLDMTSNSKAYEERKAAIEGTLTKAFNHPNVIQTYVMSNEFGEEYNPYEKALEMMEPGYDAYKGGSLITVWIVQQYCNRGTLVSACERGWLRQDRTPNSPPNLRHILLTAHEISSAVDYLHRYHAVVHGDLSGNNVLLTASRTDERGFRAIVADFGLSSVLNEDMEHRTKSIGTVSHMSPELFNEGLQTKGGDVYSFGVLLWEMWCGVRAWVGHRPGHVIHTIAAGRGRLEPTSDCPKPFAELMNKCLSFDHQKRPTFQQISKELENMMQTT